MKKYILKTALAATVLISIIGFSGCGGQSQSSAQDVSTDLLARIQDKGEIIIATEGTWSPWTYHNENDELVGFDVEVAQKVAEKLGIEVSFIEAEWDSIFAGIDAGRYDMAANGVEITDERSEKYDFSEPYAYIRTAVIVDGNNNEIQSFEDLDGKRTANTLASTYATLAERYGAEAVGVDDLNQTIELLLAGRVDATLNAEVTYYDYMNAHPEANLRIAELTEEASYVAFPMRKGEETTALREAIDQALAELADEGVLSELSEKYFGSDITQE